jgi:hypothetical protein
MLTSELHRISAAKTRIEHHVQPYPFRGADGPAALVRGDIVLGPRRKAFVVFFSSRILHSDSRVGLHVSGVECPSKQAAHGIEKVPCLKRRSGPPVSAGDDMRALDGAR